MSWSSSSACWASLTSPFVLCAGTAGVGRRAGGGLWEVEVGDHAPRAWPPPWHRLTMWQEARGPRLAAPRPPATIAARPPDDRGPRLRAPPHLGPLVSTLLVELRRRSSARAPTRTAGRAQAAFSRRALGTERLEIATGADDGPPQRCCAQRRRPDHVRVPADPTPPGVRPSCGEQSVHSESTTCDPSAPQSPAGRMA